MRYSAALVRSACFARALMEGARLALRSWVGLYRMARRRLTISLSESMLLNLGKEVRVRACVAAGEKIACFCGYCQA